MLGPRLFRRVPACTSDELRQRIQTERPHHWILLDVREPAEYAQSHIPGAVHVPLGELPQRLVELEDLPTVVYCRSGNRSAAATSLLLRAGRGDVTNLSGGILGWRGVAVSGLPEVRMPIASPEATFGEVVALALHLERGTEQWYIHLASHWQQDASAGGLFQHLAQEEERHQATLATTAANNGLSTPELAELVRHATADGIVHIEGGVSLDEAMAWSDQADLTGVLELATAIEAVAFDRYSQLARTLDPPGRSLFQRLSTGERHHYLELADALEKATSAPIPFSRHC